MDNVKNAKIIDYIESSGWAIEQSSIEISHLTIPREFDAIFQNYNAYQKEAGFDLTSFKGARATRYSYRILNHRYSGITTVRANVLVVNDEIIAADISSTEFMHAITNTTFHKEF